MTWRPLPGETPLPRPVGDSLPGLVRFLGGPDPSVLAAIFARWEELVGPRVAAHARPVRVRDGVLHVAVEQPAWAAQLSFLGPDILAKVVAATGDETIHELVVKVVARRPK